MALNCDKKPNLGCLEICACKRRHTTWMRVHPTEIVNPTAVPSLAISFLFCLVNISPAVSWVCINQPVVVTSFRFVYASTHIDAGTNKQTISVSCYNGGGGESTDGIVRKASVWPSQAFRPSRLVVPYCLRVACRLSDCSFVSLKCTTSTQQLRWATSIRARNRRPLIDLLELDYHLFKWHWCSLHSSPISLTQAAWGRGWAREHVSQHDLGRKSVTRAPVCALICSGIQSKMCKISLSSQRGQMIVE